MTERERRAFAADAAARMMRRVYLCMLLVSLAAGLLLLRLFHLQVLEHERYTTLSDENRLRVVPTAPARGRVFSRDGVLLAGHRIGYDLRVVESEAGPPQRWLERLAQLVELDEAAIQRYRRLRAQRQAFEPLTLKADLGEREVYRFSVNRHFFPGISVTGRPQRYYPRGPATAHVLGYVSRLSPEDLLRLGEDRADYTATDVIGKTGLERAYESLLHGREGYREEEINAAGRPLRVLREISPRPGRDLHLSLDAGLQLEAHALLAGKRGAVVALEPATGQVLALVSRPTFDPNLFTGGISARAYRELLESPGRPLYNRALQGQYPPGSTIKPFYALAALHHGVRGPESAIRCPGHYRVPGGSKLFRDWKRGGHGTMDMLQAIVQSCDVYFYGLAFDLGIKRMSAFLGRFGFGARTELRGGDEQAGLVPTPEWKRRVRGEPWWQGETLNTGIGQGDLLVTPMQLAVGTAVLAGRGVWRRPRLVEEEPTAAAADPGVRDDGAPGIADLDAEQLRLVQEAMRQVLHGARGTARGASLGMKYQAAGKTGTAQVVSLQRAGLLEQAGGLPEEFEDHAWFIAYAPFERPRIALAVLVENGGSGSKGAAPLARKLLDYYLVPGGDGGDSGGGG